MDEFCIDYAAFIKLWRINDPKDEYESFVLKLDGVYLNIPEDDSVLSCEERSTLLEHPQHNPTKPLLQFPCSVRQLLDFEALQHCPQHIDREELAPYLERQSTSASDSSFQFRPETDAASVQSPTPEKTHDWQPAPADGITKDEVLIAFDSLVQINLKKALGNGIGLFGDAGARTRKGTPGGKHAALWDPVILAIGLHEKYHVPIPRLKKVFWDHSFLSRWSTRWKDELERLGL